MPWEGPIMNACALNVSSLGANDSASGANDGTLRANGSASRANDDALRANEGTLRANDSALRADAGTSRAHAAWSRADDGTDPVLLGTEIVCSGREEVVNAKAAKAAAGKVRGGAEVFVEVAEEGGGAEGESLESEGAMRRVRVALDSDASIQTVRRGG